MSKLIIVVAGGGGFSWENKKLITALEQNINLDIKVFYPTTSYENRTFYVQRNCIFYHRISRRDSSYVKFVIGFLKSFIIAFKFFRKNKVSSVVSVGDSGCIPIFFAAKIFGVKTIFIESITRISSTSRTMRVIILLRLANQCLVQWENLSAPKVYFKGRLL